jgi:hypothetical protein
LTLAILCIYAKPAANQTVSDQIAISSDPASVLLTDLCG